MCFTYNDATQFLNLSEKVSMHTVKDNPGWLKLTSLRKNEIYVKKLYMGGQHATLIFLLYFLPSLKKSKFKVISLFLAM